MGYLEIIWRTNMIPLLCLLNFRPHKSFGLTHVLFLLELWLIVHVPLFRDSSNLKSRAR
jgi:hypothetical protein